MPSDIGQHTIAARMLETNNRASGFDYLRLILSLSVILWHSYVLSEGRDAAHALSALLLVPVRSILICFFALSGFLVAGSLLRCKTLFMFLGLRVVRIVPALFLEVTLSALLLGPLVTTVPLASYFSSQEFHAYFLNIVGVIHYTLPGVFTSNPFPNVINGQLWTIPWELECYIALSLLALFGLVGRRYGFAVVLALIQAYFLARGLLRPDSAADFVPGQALIMAFLYGVAAYVYRDWLPHSLALCAAAVALSVGLLLWQKGALLAPLPLAYLTVYLGLLNPHKVALIRSGDYSYGLYLYGFPLQQLVAHFGPAYQHWWLNFGLATVLGFGIAYISWNYVELPASRLRPHLQALEQRYLQLRARLLSALGRPRAA